MTALFCLAYQKNISLIFHALDATAIERERVANNKHSDI